jgi:hypothetical protein
MSCSLTTNLKDCKGKKKDRSFSFQSIVRRYFDSKGSALSLKFLTENGDEESQGHVLVVGADVTLEWGSFDSYVGQTHIPVDDA